MGSIKCNSSNDWSLARLGKRIINESRSYLGYTTIELHDVKYYRIVEVKKEFELL